MNLRTDRPLDVAGVFHARRALKVALFLAVIVLAVFAFVALASAQTGGTEPGAAAGTGAGATAAGTGATPNDVARVSRQLYCPVCPNTPLDVCETQACKDWRELIRTKLNGGESDRQIIDYFVAQYGQRVLAQPPAKGFNLLVWIIPVVFLALATAGLIIILRRWSRSRGPAPGAPQTPAFAVPEELPADYVERVEREIRSRRK
jgi:cytochrome c-type biogenesis protein CcmH